MSLPILGDLWDAFHGLLAVLPKEVKIFLALAIFLFAGATLLNVVVVLWNTIGVNGINATNGCYTETAQDCYTEHITNCTKDTQSCLNDYTACGLSQKESVCVPYQEGIFIFGINFADYWTILVILFLVPMAMFAIKWYALIFSMKK